MNRVLADELFELAGRASTLANDSSDWSQLLVLGQDMAQKVHAANDGNASKQALKVLNPVICSPNPRVCLAGLLLLEVCMRECNQQFALELAENWLGSMENIASSSEDSTIREIIMQLLVDWSERYTGKHQQLAAFSASCQRLQTQGLTAPPPSSQSAYSGEGETGVADAFGGLGQTPARLGSEERVEDELLTVRDDISTVKKALAARDFEITPQAKAAAGACNRWYLRMQTHLSAGTHTPRGGQPGGQSIPEHVMQDIRSLEGQLRRVLAEWRDKVQSSSALAAAASRQAAGGGGWLMQVGTGMAIAEASGGESAAAAAAATVDLTEGTAEQQQIAAPPSSLVAAPSGSAPAMIPQSASAAQSDFAAALEKERQATMDARASADNWKASWARLSTESEDVRLELATAKNELAVIKSRDGDAVRALQDRLNESSQDWQSKWTECRETLEDVEGSNALLTTDLKATRDALVDSQGLVGRLTVDLEQARLAEEQWRGECSAATSAKNDLAAQLSVLEAQKEENWASEQETVSALRKDIILITSERDTNATSLRAANDQLRALQASLTELRDGVAADAKAADAKTTELRGMYQREFDLRKRLHNQVQELQGNIRVYARVRPLMSSEQVSGQAEVVQVPDDNTLLLQDFQGGAHKTRQFEFDKVFVGGTSQQQVFTDTEPLLTSVLDGFNVCIFAYGQTGSGKTFTMEGNPDQPGIIPRAIDSLFTVMEERADTHTTEVFVSILEIYNENVVDLLDDEMYTADGSTALDSDGYPISKKYDIRRDPVIGMYVSNLSRIKVATPSQIVLYMKMAHTRRTAAVTAMNEHSSRSHMMVSIMTRTVDMQTQKTWVGKLTLVDLAGSERISKSEVTGVALTEAKHINKSLSALGDVVSALAQGAPHVPYRNSKLTNLLQDSLGGNSKTLMFVNVGPAESNCSETKCSLEFALRAKSVKLGKAGKNVEGGTRGGHM